MLTVPFELQNQMQQSWVVYCLSILVTYRDSVSKQTLSLVIMRLQACLIIISPRTEGMAQLE